MQDTQNLKLICFDVDGTLKTDEMTGYGKYVEGIIPESILIKLEKAGIKIAIVSPSPFLPKRYTDKNHWFKEYGSNSYRWRNVEMAMDAYDITDKSQVLYVDDLEANIKQLRLEGIESITPEEFMKRYED